MAEENRSRTIRVLAIIIVVAGVVLGVAGVTTWLAVRAQLSDASITVSDDAGRFAGQQVQGPFTAYEEANVIERHALEATGGKTYAQLDRDDPTRQTAMTAAFLRSSLYTSVVSFGVAAMSVGLGIALVLIGAALLVISKELHASPPPASAST